MVRLSSPSAAAICKATSTMAAKVRPLRSVRVSMKWNLARSCEVCNHGRLIAGGIGLPRRRAAPAAK
jgi:hypothetical protein